MTDPQSDLVAGAINLILKKKLSLNYPTTLSVEDIYNYVTKAYTDKKNKTPKR